MPFVALAALASATRWRVASARLHAFAVFVLVITAIAFLCSFATGRVEASDLRLFLLVALLPALLVIAFAWAGRLRSPWLRLPIRISSGLLTLPACALFLLICLAQATCIRRPSALPSPDGMHVALLEIQDQGALGSSSAVVKVRPSWLPWSSVVYTGGGSWQHRQGAPHSPEVRWLGPARLLVRYRPDGRRTAPCHPSAGAIQVVCEKR